MDINEKEIIIKELQIEVEVLSEKVSSLLEKEHIIKEKDIKINELIQSNRDKEKVIDQIVNSRTFKIVDSINKFFRRKV